MLGHISAGRVHGCTSSLGAFSFDLYITQQIVAHLDQPRVGDLACCLPHLPARAMVWEFFEGGEMFARRAQVARNHLADVMRLNLETWGHTCVHYFETSGQIHIDLRVCCCCFAVAVAVLQFLGAKGHAHNNKQQYNKITQERSTFPNFGDENERGGGGGGHNTTCPAPEWKTWRYRACPSLVYLVCFVRSCCAVVAVALLAIVNIFVDVVVWLWFDWWWCIAVIVDVVWLKRKRKEMVWVSFFTW